MPDRRAGGNQVRIKTSVALFSAGYDLLVGEERISIEEWRVDGRLGGWNIPDNGIVPSGGYLCSSPISLNLISSSATIYMFFFARSAGAKELHRSPLPTP